MSWKWIVKLFVYGPLDYIADFLAFIFNNIQWKVKVTRFVKPRNFVYQIFCYTSVVKTLHNCTTDFIGTRENSLVHVYQEEVVC